MNDRKLILSFLDKNYSVKINNINIVYVDVLTKKTYFSDEFFKHLELIFGYIPELKLTVQSWFDEKCATLLVELYNFFNTLDLEKRSQHCLNIINENYNDNSEYSLEFIKNRFIDYYINWFKTNKLNEMKNKVSLQYHSSNNMMALVGDINEEDFEVLDKIRNLLNEWYFDNVMDKKIKTFIERCEVRLGKTNWEIKSLDYGTFEFDNIGTFFPDETQYQKSMIKSVLKNWYEEEMFKVSEKTMKNIWM